MSRAHLDLVRQVLDHELVDAAGHPCGMVDDLELTETAGTFEVAALLVGPGAWGPRLPALFAFIAGWLVGRELTRVAWHEVAKIGERIELKKSASALGLGKLDRKASRWLKWIPGSEKKAD